MKEDKEKNYSSNKVEITTEDWIRLGLIYYLLILYGGSEYPPYFLNYLPYIHLMKFLLVATLVYHANNPMQKFLLREKSLPFIACFSNFINWSFMGVKNLLKLDIFWKNRET